MHSTDQHPGQFSNSTVLPICSDKSLVVYLINVGSSQLVSLYPLHL